MSAWDFDISNAPRGNKVLAVQKRQKGDVAVMRFVPDRVILATKCGKVTLSHFIPEEDRWMMLAKGEEPVAWMAWPTHPHSMPSEVAA